MSTAEKDGKLETFAFILEQDLSGSDLEFNVKVEWEDKMVSLKELQKQLPDIEFQDIYFDADQFDNLGGDLK